jgi:hypothetical protein
MSWLPESYVIPTSGGDFLNASKIEEGQSVKIRVLGHPDYPKTAILGYSSWQKTPEKNICHRVEFTPEAKAKLKAKGYDEPKHFWAVLIYNWEKMRPQVFEITQVTIQEQLLSLTKQPTWKKPKEYDVTISRKGQGKNTKYQVLPVGKSELPQEVRDQISASEYDVSRLMTGEDVFAGSVTPLSNITTEQLEAAASELEQELDDLTQEEKPDDVPF